MAVPMEMCCIYVCNGSCKAYSLDFFHFSCTSILFIFFYFPSQCGPFILLLFIMRHHQSCQSYGQGGTSSITIRHLPWEFNSHLGKGRRISTIIIIIITGLFLFFSFLFLLADIRECPLLFTCLERGPKAGQSRHSAQRKERGKGKVNRKG